MLITYKVETGEVVGHTGTNSCYPNGHSFDFELQHNIIPNFGGNKEEYGEFRLHDFNDKEIVLKILNDKKFELEFDDKNPIGVKIYDDLILECDKNSVITDEVCTITCSLPEVYTEETEVIFNVGGMEYRTLTKNGVCYLEYSNAIAGEYEIIASANKYTDSKIIVKVVENLEQ